MKILHVFKNVQFYYIFLDNFVQSHQISMIFGIGLQLIEETWRLKTVGLNLMHFTCKM